jgi:C4-dicarboxylate-specific signal transduction histidine kinase
LDQDIEVGMQVKKRLQINMVVTAITALVIALILFITYNRVQEAVNGGKVADLIITGSFERFIIREDFLRSNNPEAARQWASKNEQIGRLLQTAATEFKHADDNQIVADLVTDHESINRLFSTVIENRRKVTTDADSARRVKEVEARLLTQINMKTHDLVLHARQLQDASNEHVFAELKTAGIIILSIIAAVSLAAVINSWAVGRMIGERFAQLRHGSNIIGAGNLDHRIAMEGNDEFAELSRAFDSMTGELQCSYHKLETEIEERKRAEKELHKIKDELENRVQERTQELTRALEDLRRENEEKLRTLEELRTNERMLVQQSRMAAMGEMIGNISHQWRQPLNMLGLIIQEIGFSYKEGYFSAEYLEASVDKAMQVITDMSLTIDDFRNFFKPERRIETFNINEALEKTILLLEGEFKQLQVQLDIDVESECPVKGLRNEFSQVLLNILANARDVFRDRKIVEPRLTIRIFCESGRSVITIGDNAGGIPEEIIGRVFDAYFTTKGSEKGTGIGLFMSKTIIEKNMNGRLSVRNIAEGAEFRIEV